MALDLFRHRHRILTRFSETDMQGVIFNARYLDYADLAVSVYWAAVGLKLAGEDMVHFHVAHASVDFRKLIRPYEYIELCSRTGRIGISSVTTLIELRGEDPVDGVDLRAEIKLVYAHVDIETHRSCPHPAHVRALLEAFDGREDVVLSGERN